MSFSGAPCVARALAAKPCGAIGLLNALRCVAFALALPISMVLFTFLRWCEVEGPCRLPPLSGVASSSHLRSTREWKVRAAWRARQPPMRL